MQLFIPLVWWWYPTFCKFTCKCIFIHCLEKLYCKLDWKHLDISSSSTIFVSAPHKWRVSDEGIKCFLPLHILKDVSLKVFMAWWMRTLCYWPMMTCWCLISSWDFEGLHCVWNTVNWLTSDTVSHQSKPESSSLMMFVKLLLWFHVLLVAIEVDGCKKEKFSSMSARSQILNMKITLFLDVTSDPATALPMWLTLIFWRWWQHMHQKLWYLLYQAIRNHISGDHSFHHVHVAVNIEICDTHR
jgi:hypothetical protein